MDEPTDDYQPSRGLGYALAGVALFVIGCLLLTNTVEGDAFLVLGLISTSAGGYLLLVGAVARGIQLARD
jgi:hypothetical protein